MPKTLISPSLRVAPRAAAAVAALILAAVTLWAFAPALDNGFVWDDGANLVAARAYWGQGVQGIVWAFTRPFYGHYQPLTWISYRVDVLLSNATPRGVHLTNLLLHGTAALLVAALAWILGGLSAWKNEGVTSVHFRRRAAASVLSAALFALHPIHVESVAWATERRDLLSTVLVLAAVLLHVRDHSREMKPGRHDFVVAMLHALSALARAQMSLPFVLLALDVGPLNRLQSSSDRRATLLRLIAEKRFSFAVAAASAVAALWAQARTGALTPASEHGFLDRMVQTGYSLAFYPSALVYRPHWLPLYERPYPFSPLSTAYLVPALIAVVGLGALVAAYARRPASAVVTAFASYVLLVLPVSGLAQSGVQLVADRYAYLATVPLILLAAFGLARLLTGAFPLPFRSGLSVATLVFLTHCAVTTRRQTQVWTNDETLWRHVLSHSDSCLADNNLGQILLARGEAGSALFHLTRSLDRVPVYPRPWASIVAILEGPWPNDAPAPRPVAITLARAAAARPGDTLPAYASALAWLRAGERERAGELLRGILTRNPGHEGARAALDRLESGFSAPR